MKRILILLAGLAILLAAACSKSESPETASTAAPAKAAASEPSSETTAGDASLAEPPIATSSDITEQDVEAAPRIEPQRAWELARSGQAVIVDVRSPSQWEAERIAGSTNIPLWDLEKRIGELDSTRWVITSCT